MVAVILDTPEADRAKRFQKALHIQPGVVPGRQSARKHTQRADRGGLASGLGRCTACATMHASLARSTPHTVKVRACVGGTGMAITA